MTVAALPTIRFPWETAGLASLVIATPMHMPWLATCVPIFGAPPQTMMAIVPGTRVCDLPEVAAKRRRIMATAGEKIVDDKRYVQVMRWLMILQLDPHASQVGMHILQVQDDEFAADKVLAVVTDALATKSTSTFQVRSTALLMYIKWYRAFVQEAEKPVPLLESYVYQYLTHLKAQAAPATRAASLLQAWAFCVHSLGFFDPTALEHSLRCRGSAHHQFLSKRRLHRKDAIRIFFWQFSSWRQSTLRIWS